ncbi:LamB/YcsF family protein [Paenibacillus sp. y28]|uniref:LamB/YcsF family protein n=1 Tax=Paenibacillus sp. y28 TaxID=3129110 RepID=UPI00301B4933
MQPVIDLNCDAGESYGAYRIGQDDKVLPHVTSANIACGFHAGDPGVMRRTVQLCLVSHVAIGAHPGLPDLAGFGRRELRITPEEAYEMTVYQIGALQAVVRAEGGGGLRHVKPHGALYNMAAADRPLADAIVRAVCAAAPEALLYGLAGSELLLAAQAAGLPAVSEVFADRRYRADGSLVPRHQDGAVLTDPEAVLAQAVRLAAAGEAETAEGAIIGVDAGTLCIHGDHPHAAEAAVRLRQRLEQEGITIRAPQR